MKLYEMWATLIMFFGQYVRHILYHLTVIYLKEKSLWNEFPHRSRIKEKCIEDNFCMFLVKKSFERISGYGGGAKNALFAALLLYRSVIDRRF